MLMQNFGVTNKEHYGMLWYFLEWSIAHVWYVKILRWLRGFLVICYIWFDFLCAQVTSGNFETMESWKICNFLLKASESCYYFNISNVGYSQVSRFPTTRIWNNGWLLFNSHPSPHKSVKFTKLSLRPLWLAILVLNSLLLHGILSWSFVFLLHFLTDKSNYYPMIKESPKGGKSCYFTIEVNNKRNKRGQVVGRNDKILVRPFFNWSFPYF